jgi:hypothetical protein
MASIRTAKVKKKAINKTKSAAGPMGPGVNIVPPSAIGSAISAAGPVPSANLIEPTLANQVDQIEMAKAAVASPVVPVPAIAPYIPQVQKQMDANQAAFRKASVKKKKPNMAQMASEIEAGRGKQYIKKTAKVKKGY